MHRVEGVILDWAGTTIDFGCFAPVQAFIETFESEGIAVTIDEARAPMGMLKRDHIRAMLQMPRIESEWIKKTGRCHDEIAVERLYSRFEPLLMESIANYAEPLPGVVDTVSMLRREGLKIGSTTGYTDSMMQPVARIARDRGYSPDIWVTPDSTGSCGRPNPYMVFKNMEALRLSATWKTVKVGDTLSDIKEGLNAGVWSVGVIAGSSQMGLTFEEFAGLPKAEKELAINRTREAFLSAGADFAISEISELPELIDTINLLISNGSRPGSNKQMKK